MVTVNAKTPASGKAATSSVTRKTSTTKKEIVKPKLNSKSTPATGSKTDIVSSPATKVTVKKVTTQKPVVEKPKPAKKIAAPKKLSKKAAVVVSPEHRYHMIATAAYFLAERRGFAGGYEMHDWISAEAEVDAKLNS